LYDFPAGLASVLRSKSMRVRLQRTWNSVRPWLSWGGRVLFGASLLTTIVVLYAAILVLMTASVSNKNDSSGNSVTLVSQNNFAMWFGQDLFFWLFPPSGGYYGNYGYYGFSYRPPKMSFLEAIFSFVFGDGDPNTQLLNESRWQLIGRCIADSGGVVAAEQLAPFLDPPDLEATSESTRGRSALDRAILPVLLRFRGKPEVTSEGDILYVFPELQESRAIGQFAFADLGTSELKRRLKVMGRPTSAADRPSILDDYQKAQEQRALSAEFVEERELKFSEAEPDQIASCTAYGAFALLATLWFGLNLLSGKAQILARVHPVVNLVVKAYPVFFGYTTAFLAIPAWRMFRIGRANQQIRARNAWREQQATRLKPPFDASEQGLQQRLLRAAKRALQRRSFGKAIYNSSMPSEDRNWSAAEDDLRSFDRRLGEV